jgi:hypothetical protein
MIGVLIGATLRRETSVIPQTPSPTGALPIEGEPPSFHGAKGWLNSPPRAAGELRGKVVLYRPKSSHCRTTATKSQPISFCALIKALLNLPLTSGARTVASSPLPAKKSLASSAR